MERCKKTFLTLTAHEPFAISSSSVKWWTCFGLITHTHTHTRLLVPSVRKGLPRSCSDNWIHRHRIFQIKELCATICFAGDMSIISDFLIETIPYPIHGANHGFTSHKGHEGTERILRIFEVCWSWSKHDSQFLQETWMGWLLIQHPCACDVAWHRRNVCEALWIVFQSCQS